MCCQSPFCHLGLASQEIRGISDPCLALLQSCLAWGPGTDSPWARRSPSPWGRELSRSPVGLPSPHPDAGQLLSRRLRGARAAGIPAMGCQLSLAVTSWALDQDTVGAADC